MASTDDSDKRSEKFLRDFDRRRDAAREGRKPGDAPPEGESASGPGEREDRDLLEFADLVRERCEPDELELAEAKERLEKKLAERSASPPPEDRRGTWSAPFRRNVFLLALVPVAAIFLAVCLLIFSRGPGDEDGTGKDGSVPAGRARATLVDPSTLASTSRDDFAGVEFPDVKAEAASSKDLERALQGDPARLLRSKGLVLVRRKDAKLWRLLKRRATISPGDSVRTSRRLKSSAALRGPEGTRVAVGPGTRMVYESKRKWRILAGSAHFKVATGEGLGDFTVEGPTGSVVAKGTEFSLTARPDSTLCRVAAGAVEIAPHEGPEGGAPGRAITLARGESGIIHGTFAERAGELVEFRWLQELDADDPNAHGLGEILARAVGDKDADMLPLEVKSHRVTVTVVHPVARTFIDEVFVNNTDRDMEGIFYYPLPPDAAVSEFAMYVDGKRILGEVLEQHRARQVFEYIRRQQRDPALLEWVGGNLFKMRVYPIFPHSEKRVQLAYTQVLKRDRGKVTYTYPLVSEKLKKNPLRSLGLQFRVTSSQGLSDLWCTSHRAETVLTTDGRGALAFGAKDYTPERDFTVTYRVDEEAELLSFANARPDEKEPYFLLELAPKVELPVREPPRRLLVITDASPSVGPRGYALVTEFASVAADFSLDWEMNVIVAGAEPEKWQPDFVDIDEDTPDEVRAFLAGRRLLGATDLKEAFREAARLVADGEPTEIVYVGDGIDTLGELEGSALVREIA
ncbi:MAG: VIT domain-containing protein, partial [Planctomycetota bacterium]